MPIVENESKDTITVLLGNGDVGIGSNLNLYNGHFTLIFQDLKENLDIGKRVKYSQRTEDKDLSIEKRTICVQVPISKEGFKSIGVLLSSIQPLVDIMQNTTEVERIVQTIRQLGLSFLQPSINIWVKANNIDIAKRSPSNVINDLSWISDFLDWKTKKVREFYQQCHGSKEAKECCHNSLEDGTFNKWLKENANSDTSERQLSFVF